MELKYFSALIGVKMDEKIKIMLQEYLGDTPIVSSDLDFIEDPLDFGGRANLRTYYIFESLGVEMSTKEEIIDSIYLFVKKKNIRLSIERECKININSAKEDVLRILGNPDNMGGGEEGPLGFIGEWFIYFKNNIYINVTFSEKLKVELICLMADFDI